MVIIDVYKRFFDGGYLSSYNQYGSIVITFIKTSFVTTPKISSIFKNGENFNYA